MEFRNTLRKIKNKDEWTIYSGTHAVAKLRKQNDLHYLRFEKQYEYSIEELNEVLDICFQKVGKKRFTIN